MLLHVLRIGLSLLLTLTAAIKFFDAPTILGSGGLLASPMRLSIAIGFELFAGVVIAIAPPRVAHRFASLVFFSLASIAGWAWWTETDCGCFGSRTLKGAPLIIDLVAIGLLLGCSHSVAKLEAGSVTTSRSRSLRPVGIGIVVGLLACGVTHSQIEQLSSEFEIPAWFGDNLIGMQFPLLRDEKLDAVLAPANAALLVMLRPDCEHCREVTQQWAALKVERANAVQVIGVSVEDGRWTFMPNEVSHMPIGADDEFEISWEKVKEPFVAAPTFVAIRDRVVTGVAAGEDASELLNKDDWVQSLFEAANQ